MATTRLRKAFKYPEELDADPSEPVEGVDEQEQERQITNLVCRDEASNAFYRKILLSLSTLSSSFYIFLLSIPSNLTQSIPLNATLKTHIPLTLLTTLSSAISTVMIYDIPASGIDTTTYHTVPQRDKPYFGLANRFRDKRPSKLKGKGTGHLAAWEIPPTVLGALFVIQGCLCVTLILAFLVSPGLGTRDVLVIEGPAWVSLLTVALAFRDLRKLDRASLDALKYSYKGA